MGTLLGAFVIFLFGYWVCSFERPVDSDWRS